MKKILYALLAGVFTLGTMAACSTGDDGNGGENKTGSSTETAREFDNSNYGLYKGVIAGSSGTIRIEINNGKNKAHATIVMDGVTDQLTSNVTFIQGQAISNALFTGKFSSFRFSVRANGGDPEIVNMTIEGHDKVIAAVSKEKSGDVAVCYEGTSVGRQDHSGVFNIVRNSNTFSGVSNSVDGFSCSIRGNIGSDGSFSGSSNTTFNGLDVKLNYSGKFNGNQVSGTWSNSWDGGTNSGSFTGSKVR